jgi:hypothetical protein
VYAELDDPDASLQLRQEALYFCVYQLMRTVGLTLVGQYLHAQEPPDAAVALPQDRLNQAILGLRSPYFSSWIDLLNALHRYAGALGLDALPEHAPALEAVKAREARVDVPPEYGLEHGRRWQGLTLWEAFLALRNHSAHSGSRRDERCRADLVHFRPLLDRLLGHFLFLARYELLVVDGDPMREDEPLVRTLRGASPAPGEPLDLAAHPALYAAFRDSPVVLRSPDGRVQPLFPLFHGHLEGEPLRCYDGHYLHSDPRLMRRTIYYLGCAARQPLDDAGAASPGACAARTSPRGPCATRSATTRAGPWRTCAAPSTCPRTTWTAHP